MADPSPNAGSARKPASSRGPGLFVAFVAPIAVPIGFIVTSALASRVNANRWWLLGAGLVATLVLPALIASWLRTVGGKRRARPTTTGAIVAANLAVIVAAVVLAPGTTRAALHAQGTWWAQGIAKAASLSDDAPLVPTARRIVDGLAAVLPGEDSPPRPLPTPAAKTDAGPPSGDAIAAPWPDTIAPDSRPSSLAEGDAIRIGFERRGTAIIVPVRFAGPERTTVVRMIFDTGASYTTIDTRTLRRLGLYVTGADPTIITHTANGRVRRTLAVVDSIAVGRAKVGGGLTVTVCDACASGDTIGLLGLNYSRNFRVEIDHGRGELVLRPPTAAVARLTDIRPFVALKSAKGMRRGPLLTVSLRLANNAPRALSRVRVIAQIAGEEKSKIWGALAHVPPRSELPMKLQGLLGDEKGAGSFTLKLEAAHW